MGLIDLPSSRDFIESVDWVIPSDKRDFTRSTPDWAVTFPRDSNLADTGSDPFIMQVQQTMKNNPISFPYVGPVDGKKSGKSYDHLRNVLIQFGWALEKKFPGQLGAPLVSGGKISQKAFIKAMSLLSGGLKPKDEEDESEELDEEQEEAVKSNAVALFQEFFSSAQPLIGTLYSGPQDGEINENLISAAKATESAIAAAIDDNKANGMIWSDSSNSFNTSPDDVKSALQLIFKHKKEATNHNTRMMSFAAILS